MNWRMKPAELVSPLPRAQCVARLRESVASAWVFSSNAVVKGSVGEHRIALRMRISYRKVEIVKEVQGIEHNVFRECLKLCNFERDIELHNLSVSRPSLEDVYLQLTQEK